MADGDSISGGSSQSAPKSGPKSATKPATGPTGDDDSSGSLWQGIKSLLFPNDQDQSLRAQLEETIDAHDEDDDEDSDDSNNGSGNGDLSRVEREMLRNLLHFSEHDADKVAVPRREVIAIDRSASFADVIATFAEHGHSRLPVYDGSLDTIIGMVHIKDFFAVLAEGCDHPDDWSDKIRQPLYVPESMGALDLLAEMRASRMHLAIVLDEYSGTEGIVTIEDLVEEIVGEIEDEHDDERTELLIQRPDGSWDADASAELDDVAKAIDPVLAEVAEDIDTLGGLAFILAEEVPQPGRMLEHDSGWKLQITEGDEKRVTRLVLHPPEDESEAA